MRTIVKGRVVPSGALLKDHRHAPLGQVRQNLLGLLVELHQPLFGLLFERVPDQLAGLVVFDSQRMPEIVGPIVRPLQVARQDVLRPL
jgi:hypothetical protein